MDLWIRSQDKRKLLKCNDIAVEQNMIDLKEIIKFEGYKIVGYFDKNTEYETLGIYDTEDRALEVLDEINEYIEKQGQTIAMTNEKGIVDGLKYYGKTYVMPEE